MLKTCTPQTNFSFELPVMPHRVKREKTPNTLFPSRLFSFFPLSFFLSLFIFFPSHSCHALPRRPPPGRPRVAAPLPATTAIPPSPPSSPLLGSKPTNVPNLPTPTNSTKNTSDPTNSNNQPPSSSYHMHHPNPIPIQYNTPSIV